MEHEEIFEHFIANAIILDVLEKLKSGKEALVYRCSAHPSAGVGQVAIKIYKDPEKRSFRSMNSYLDGRIGRTIRKRRDILHLYVDPDAMQAFWVFTEWQALCTLYDGGLSVPKPLLSMPSAIAMELIGDTDDATDATAGSSTGSKATGSAPRLRDAGVPAQKAAKLRDTLIASIRTMLSHDVIHGDLSPYNILMQGDRPVIIDFPQAADPRYSTQGRAMLERDVRNVLNFFPAAPDSPDPSLLASQLWQAWDSGELQREREAILLARQWGLAEKYDGQGAFT